MIEDQTENLRTRLTQGDIDAAVVALPWPSQGFNITPLFEEPLFWMSSEPGPFQGRTSPLHIDDLPDDELLVLGEGHCLRDHVIQSCNARSVRSQVHATSPTTLIGMVASGIGSTLVPAMAIDDIRRWYGDTVVILPFAGGPKRSIAVWTRNTTPSNHLLTSVTKILSSLSHQTVSVMSQSDG